jgi:hypothetical protein
MNKKILSEKDKTMKTKLIFLPVFLAALLGFSCSNLVQLGSGGKSITPSDVNMTEERVVSGFSSINMSTLGRVLLTQGEGESLIIEGRDNLVPLIKTEVRDGVLHIDMDENVNLLLGKNDNDLLTFTISLKDLTALTVSGLADVEMVSLSTDGLTIDMSGAGQFKLGQLNAESITIKLGGLGNVDISGEVTQETIDISGAGSVNAADLKCQTANVNIPGLGGATVWVTDTLTGNISGGGSVSYYGDPVINTETSGLGKFNALGSK